MTWTEGRIRGFLTSVLRAGFAKWPPKWEAKKEACVGREHNKKSGRLALHYKCASCKKHFLGTEVEVDHIIPVVDPFTGFTTWDDYINRLFCSADNLQVLCKPCHKKKSAKERKLRK